MGLILQCDGGCGACAEHDSEMAKRGFVEHCYYCESCDLAYQEYQKAVDALHTACAEQFTNGLAVIQAQWKSNHLKAKLPDN